SACGVSTPDCPPPATSFYCGFPTVNTSSGKVCETAFLAHLCLTLDPDQEKSPARAIAYAKQVTGDLKMSMLAIAAASGKYNMYRDSILPIECSQTTKNPWPDGIILVEQASNKTNDYSFEDGGITLKEDDSTPLDPGVFLYIMGRYQSALRKRS